MSIPIGLVLRSEGSGRRMTVAILYKEFKMSLIASRERLISVFGRDFLSCAFPGSNVSGVVIVGFLSILATRARTKLTLEAPS